jgi:hypothetical protein
VSKKTGEPRPTVFISYSHRDEGWKDRLETALKAAGVLNGLEIWSDCRIGVGDGWEAEILAAMDRATVAILLISDDFLASKYIREVEVPRLRKRQKAGTLRILPLFVRPSTWKNAAWLTPIQGRPKDAKPLSKCRKADADEHLSALAQEVHSYLKAPPASPLSRGREGGRRERGPGGEVQPRLDLSRLPIPGPYLIGRETELARLDAAWEDPDTRVLTLVSFGGTGKSALVTRWLERMSVAGWRGAQRVLDWSFYSQGTEDRVTSADRFLDHALGWFGDPNPKEGLARDRGLRLAELVRKETTLLVLDGVEPLQHPPNHPLAGRLKDPGLAALLKSLAASNPGLCVVTSRERIADLDAFSTTAPQEDLESLSPEAGAELLKALGVNGRGSELIAASKRFGNHALTLSLLGGYLARAYGGDLRRSKEVDLAGAAKRKGGHALRTIGTYASWLGEGPELAALRLLGLFDRPAQPRAIAALRAKPAIPGLTEPLVYLREEDWQLALFNLREQGLLLPADPHQPGTLDAHPLVRVYFQEELTTLRPQAWEAGNLRIYELLQTEAPDLPDTLEEMEPLYMAVIHGCQAGRKQEVLDEIYRRRIQRGAEFFSTVKLGAVGSDLSALCGFFDHVWDQPSTTLTLSSQAFVLNEAGVNLCALGRLAEAIQPIAASLEMYLRFKDWREAAIIASNLGELNLTLGYMSSAVLFGKQSVNLADSSGDSFWRIVTRTTLADALYQLGAWEESAKICCEADALQVNQQPYYPRLSGLRYYQFCDQLRSFEKLETGALYGFPIDAEVTRRLREACVKVRDLAEQMLKSPIAATQDILSVALESLSLGRAHWGLAMTSHGVEAEAAFGQAAKSLEYAVEGLRRTRFDYYLPSGLLARASLRQLRNDLHGAETDISEALEIAEWGLMRLLECDAHLEWAWLCRQRGDREGLKKHVTTARTLVDEMGYGRRRGEVELLEGQLR